MKLNMEMKTLLAFALAALLVQPAQAAQRKNRLEPYKDPSRSVDERVEDLLSRMSLEEKIGQLTQTHTRYVDNENNYVLENSGLQVEYGSYIYYSENPVERNEMQKNALENTRLGIPILFGFDVIHGYRTVYPIPLAQAASFNTALAGDCARVAANEAYRAGIDWTFSPMVDIARDGRWGRISEGYGEDPFLNASFCSATVKAYQGEDLSLPGNIAACMKHYVAYGASEAGRDYVPTDISRQSLWETYLPPYIAGIESGAATVMSSFNTLNGIPASACEYTLKDVLREQLGFEGVVVSDWQAILQLINQGFASDGKEAARLAFNAGVDMDMTDDLYPMHLAALVEQGEVDIRDIDESVRRILKLKFELGLFENPYRDEDLSEAFLSPEYRNTAREMAQESAVLLKNEGRILPLSGVSSIALVGPVADDADALLGNWNGRGKKKDVITIAEGLRKAFPGVKIVQAKGCGFDGELSEAALGEALEAVRSCDVAVVCLGERSSWSGENCSRSTIALPQVQEEFLRLVRNEGRKTVVVLSSGRPLDLVRIEPLCDAMMEIWQPGVEGGNAVANLLSGKANPSGKLPVTFPYTSGQIPIYYNRRNPARTGSQGRYQDIPSEPLYEFGYGLSYSEFEYGEIKASRPVMDGKIVLSSDSEPLRLSIDVRNLSSVGGQETALWYVSDPVCSIARPVKELKHFEKRFIPAHGSASYEFEIIPSRDLSYIDDEGHSFLEKGEYIIRIADKQINIVLK